jgi:methionyl-tRNA formyltransferase
MRIVYCGTPDDAVPPLRALHEAGHDVALVVTQPDRRRGRGSAVAPSPVKAAAEELGLDVRTPVRARELTDEIAALGADLGVVVAFGQLLPGALLEATRLGFVNLHFSLLPRWRGAAPVERAVLAGDEETGVCVMQLDEGLDTGPVYECVRTRIDDDESAGELRARLVELGTPLLVDVVGTIDERTPQPQSGESTSADKLSVEEFRLDATRPAAELARLVRAGNPRPGAWARIDGRRIKVLRAHVERSVHEQSEETRPHLRIGLVDEQARLHTSAGVLVLDEVQPEGKGAMPGTAWRAGVRTAAPILEP